MDEIISDYIKKEFCSDVVTVLIECFILFEKFAMQYYQGDLLEIISSYSNSDPSDVKDRFISKIKEKINLVYSEHSLEIEDDIPLGKHVELLNGLYNIMELEDYSSIISIIESNKDPEEKVSLILAEFTTFSESECYTFIKSVDNIFIEKLKTFIVQRQKILNKSTYGIPDESKKIYANFKKFRDYYRETISTDFKPIGEILIEADVIVGREFEAYKAYLNDVLANTEEKTLLFNIISFLMLTKEGNENLILCYKNNAIKFFTDISLISKFDSLVQTTLNDFNAYLTRKEGYK